MNVGLKGCHSSFVPSGGQWSAVRSTHPYTNPYTNDFRFACSVRGWYANLKSTADTIMALELCALDTNKPLLLANTDFIPYLVDALLLDPDHPRAGLAQDLLQDLDPRTPRGVLGAAGCV